MFQVNKVLVIGGGGREHAICWKLANSDQVEIIFAAPGGVGIEGVNQFIGQFLAVRRTESVSLNITDFKGVCDWCHEKKVDLVVVGPEDPLANGIADALMEAGIPCFGPSQLAARIEADKDWAKRFMDRHGIPTARWKGFTSADEAVNFINSAEWPALVVKAAGLAAGKGVVVAANRAEACAAVRESLVDRKFGAAGDIVIVEELLEGPEVSVLGFCDGETVKAMPPAQDHKRALDGDLGPNTGGMGAYCPCPLLSAQDLQWVEQNILQRAVDGLKHEGCPFVGVLYAGLMLTSSGPKVLEFNCRFGDPETEVILPLLKSDLYNIMSACCRGRLKEHGIFWYEDRSAVTVVMASRGYPQSSSKGDLIKGLEKVKACRDMLVFHCGTAVGSDGGVVTAGGRVLAVTARSASLPGAAARAVAACEIIRFPGAQYRTDIAHKGIARWILERGLMTYKASGVDITAGNSLVTAIKPAVAATTRAGVMGQIGGFGALFDLRQTKYTDPILVSGTDGVGTKLKIAQETGDYSTLGQDLVAMCVNDVLCQGAEPLFFLDYFACGKLEVGVAADIVKSIADACAATNCSLVGGETAEMPGLYGQGDFDLAGFVVGVAERSRLLPRLADITPGDIVFALPSSGVHSNGFSLVRKVMAMRGLTCRDNSPFSDRTLGEELLTPTALYVKPLLPVLGLLKAAAHITGGGLLENIPRVLPEGIKVTLDATRWTVPPVFAWISAAGMVSETEMLRTFNCGVGMVLIVAAEHANDVKAKLPDATIIGNICQRVGEEAQVTVSNFAAVMEPAMQRHVSPLVRQLAVRKRVGVLISGSGTNLQSLIDATTGSGSTTIGAEIVMVISNKPYVEGLNRAQRAGIPTKVKDNKDYATRAVFEEQVMKCLLDAGVEIVCLAGFMRVLTGGFVRAWRGHIINIHPALLPLFKGTHAHRQALQAGVRITGCTVHFVEEDVDAGAIIAQKAVDIEVGDTEASLAERVKVAEHEIYPKALQLLATGRIKLDTETNKIIWQ